MLRDALLIVTLMDTCVNGACNVETLRISADFCAQQLEDFAWMDPEKKKYDAKCEYLIPELEGPERSPLWWENLGGEDDD